MLRGGSKQPEEDDGETMLVETINVTSANGASRPNILKRKAALQCLQEMCLSEEMQAAFKNEAKGWKKTFLGGPTDPEKAKAAAGVGFTAVKGLNIYGVPKPTKDYLDAVRTGRLLIVCMDVEGTTLACATVYGWTGGSKGNVEAERTDDLLAIAVDQFSKMKPGPKMIAGDLNATIDALPTLEGMLKEQGWTDVGNHPGICQGKVGQPTCQSSEKAKESRIDYIITNEYLTPSIKRCWVEQAGDFPTHRPLLIEVSVKRMQRTTNQLIKPTNFAEMFEAKVQKEIAEAEVNLQQQRKDEVQHSGEKRKKQKGVDESEIRKRNLNELHALMDVQIRKRQHRIKYAQYQRNTTRQWDLVAAAVEQANIDFHNLTKAEATKMRGRSKVAFKQDEKTR